MSGKGTEETGISSLQRRLESDLLSGLNVLKMCQPVDEESRKVLGKRAEMVDLMCAKCVFFAKCIRYVLMQTKTQREFRIAVVGGEGMVGKELVKALSTMIDISNIIILSRGESHTFYFHGLRRTSCYEEAIAKFSPRLVFLACQASHLEQVAKSVRGFLKPTIALCSLAAGISCQKLSKLFNTSQTFRAVQHNLSSRSVSSSCSSSSFSSSSSPVQHMVNASENLSSEERETLFRFRDVLVTQATSLGLSQKAALPIVSAVVFGNSEREVGKIDPVAFRCHFLQISDGSFLRTFAPTTTNNNISDKYDA